MLRVANGDQEFVPQGAVLPLNSVVFACIKQTIAQREPGIAGKHGEWKSIQSQISFEVKIQDRIWGIPSPVLVSKYHSTWLSNRALGSLGKWEEFIRVTPAFSLLNSGTLNKVLGTRDSQFYPL